MTTLPSPAIVDRPFAAWPGTLQVMPEGILDAGFGRFLVGVQIQNTSPTSWPAGEARITPRSRRVLATAGIAVGDGWWDGDASAAGQRPLSEWIPIGTVAASAYALIFFKMDATNATPGVHLLEIELRNPGAISAGVTTTSAPLLVARTTMHGSRRTFTSACSEGVVTTSVGALSVDQELFRRAIGKAREIAGLPGPGTRSLAETERLRQRLGAVLCGEDPDVCATLADLTGSCAVPVVPAPGPAGATGLAVYAAFSDQTTILADRARISDGDVGSNHAIDVGIDAVLGGSVAAGGDVQLRERSIVVGGARTAGLLRRSAGSTVAGLSRQQSSFTSLTIPTKTVSPGSTNLSGNQNLAPGNYGAVTIGANATLTLRAGTYNFAALTFAAGAILVLDQSGGSVDARVRDNLQFGDRLDVRLTNSTPAPTALAQFYSNQTSEVLIGVDVPLLRAVVSVPNGTVRLGARSNLVGALYGKTVKVDADATISRAAPDVWVGTGGTGLELLAYPASLDYTVDYPRGFAGTTGPLAFERVFWKALVTNAMLQLDLGIGGAVASEVVALADQMVVGTVKTSVLNAPTTAPGTTPPATQAGSVDASVAKVRGNRSLGFPPFAYLDAAPGEPNSTPVTVLDGKIPTPGGFLTNAEISTILANAGSDPAGLKVYKSGAATGVTRGILSALLPVVPRDDAGGTLQFINQLLIVADPQSPAADGKVAGPGDSGGLWIQTRSNKVMGLCHAVGTSGALASRIEDVVTALQIQIS